MYLNEEEKIASTIVQSILNHYQQQYSLFTHLGQNGLLNEEMSYSNSTNSSEIKTIAQQENISSSTYYTFSMAVMFILYIAGTLASQAFIEKNTHIFDRIITSSSIFVPILIQHDRFNYYISIYTNNFTIYIFAISYLASHLKTFHCISY